ncbi:MAG: cupin domain-containing protein [Phycisphaerales bacterium]
MSHSKLATIHTFASLPTDFPMPLISRRRIMGDNMMMSHVVLEPGFTLAPHSHENEQFVVMLNGFAKFTLGQPGNTREVELRTGQVIVLPPHEPHGCVAIERCEVLDLFSPPSATTGVDRK